MPIGGRAGISRVNMAIAVAVGLSLTGVGVWQYRALTDLQAQIQLHSSFEVIRDQVRVLVAESAAWENTLKHPRNRFIDGARGGLIDLLDANGAVVFATTDHSAGLTAGGRPCNKLGFGDCAIKLQLAWEAVCTQADCANPARLVTARFMSASNFNSKMDLSLLNFQTLRPAPPLKSATLATCRRANEYWQGVDPSTGQMVCRSAPVQLNLVGVCREARPECVCRKMGAQIRFPAVCMGSRWGCNCENYWLRRMGFI